MNRQSKYQVAKRKVLSGQINTLRELFDIVSYDDVAIDLNIPPEKLTILINNIGRFTLREVYQLASLFQIDDTTMIDLVHNQFLQDSGIVLKRSSGLRKME